jgi:hypothetical protein
MGAHDYLRLRGPVPAHGRAEDALELWRGAERYLARPALEPEWRADYERAVWRRACQLIQAR